MMPGKMLQLLAACFSLVAMPIAAVLDHAANLLPRRF